jgi:hypothetical protein
MPAAAANATTTGQNKTGAYEITAPDNQQTGPLALRFLTLRAKAGGYCILSSIRNCFGSAVCLVFQDGAYVKL